MNLEEQEVYFTEIRSAVEKLTENIFQAGFVHGFEEGVNKERERVGALE